MPRDESKGGFTLVELMIVVAIIGVLAAIAIPNWLDMNYRAKRAEMPIIVNAVQHAEFGFDGLYDGFVMADPHPGGVPSKGYQNWGAGNTGFNHLGFLPDGDVRSVYQVTTVVGRATTNGGEFTVIGIMDVDAHTVLSKYTATHIRGTRPLTKNDVY